VEVEKVVPNPFQPRREFDQDKLQELADSIRMYGVLQPLTVTRNEVQRGDGTFYTEYELIAGERRLRASKLAQVPQVPVIIREGEQSQQEKLELAIIENLQREDLNAVDRALAFKQLSEVFGLSHGQVAQKVGRSREYVSNSIRLLGLPEHMLEALRKAQLSEGHARTLLMLNDRPEEQDVVFQEILLKKLSVREVERIARKIATDKIRKRHPDEFDAQLIEIEKRFTETLGTRVQIQRTDFGGKLTIDYFSTDDLEVILKRMHTEQAAQLSNSSSTQAALETLTERTGLEAIEVEGAFDASSFVVSAPIQPDVQSEEPLSPQFITAMHDTMVVPEISDDDAANAPLEAEEDDSDLYSMRNFTV
jgi:ParB family chromosome partitioning protein